MSAAYIQVHFRLDFIMEANTMNPDQTASWSILFAKGSYRQVSVKFKDFSRTSKRLPYCFQGLKTYENTGLHVKNLLLKC